MIRRSEIGAAPHGGRIREIVRSPGGAGSWRTPATALGDGRRVYFRPASEAADFAPSSSPESSPSTALKSFASRKLR
jgi:hypothetical protein